MKGKEVEVVVWEWKGEGVGRGRMKKGMGGVGWWGEKVGKEKWVGGRKDGGGIEGGWYVGKEWKGEEVEERRVEGIGDEGVKVCVEVEEGLGVGGEEGLKFEGE